MIPSQELVSVRAEAGMLLAPRGVAVVALSDTYDPKVYYQTRPGLSVGLSFIACVLRSAKKLSASVTLKIACTELVRTMTNKEFETGLVTNHFFNETSACSVVASLIPKQPNGEKGVLRSDGLTNLFYLSPCCFIGVYWSSMKHWWSIDVWGRDNYSFRQGDWVFSLGGN